MIYIAILTSLPLRRCRRFFVLQRKEKEITQAKFADFVMMAVKAGILSLAMIFKPHDSFNDTGETSQTDIYSPLWVENCEEELVETITASYNLLKKAGSLEKTVAKIKSKLVAWDALSEKAQRRLVFERTKMAFDAQPQTQTMGFEYDADVVYEERLDGDGNKIPPTDPMVG